MKDHPNADHAGSNSKLKSAHPSDGKAHHDSHGAKGHHHEHAHGTGGHVHVAQNKLRTAIFLGFFVLIAEVIGGLWANSLALISDAGHMLTDVAALIVAWYANKVSSNPSSGKMTYGYHRATILAAMFNALTLVVIAVFIGAEAYKRFLHPQPVEGSILFIVAAIGIAINLYIGLGMRGHADNMNIKSAMLHVFGDAAASAGVILAGIVMYYTHWYILDPIISVVIAVIVAVGAWKVIKETYIVLMEGTPRDIDFEEVVSSIRSVPGVEGIHDLHIWSLTSNRNTLTGHIVVDGSITVMESQEILRSIEKLLQEKHRIGHTTLQVEHRETPHSGDMFSMDDDWVH